MKDSKRDQTGVGTMAGVNGASYNGETCQHQRNKDRMTEIAHHFGRIMEVLGLDLDDPSLKDTPARVAKMFLNEAFIGLDEAQFPEVSFFDNTYNFDEMVVVNDISLYSYCEHHFVPFFGKVNVAYFPNKKVIGLSKINRIVDFIGRKPQVQEKLTREIAETLSALLDTEHVAVYVEANHLCVASRGIKDHNSHTKTGSYLGKFKNEWTKKEFMSTFQ
ncbi:GTP cyclohydrolase I FolE [Flagellimonas aequoris]|uniref:GTP cyclohydrolase 1 n=1 Tax=Flagellimonas aequoris TaxID=2306997 RepID=A0A418N8E2_9FLAO|nr:GTP cyclohydrolase I FolE [Allomuricauda aequoris]RIV71637.1 GTP cyclohydrolase I FolE [Allomuricauda aequoris]TXK03200.1 GTP cyclohydrolase I FolE [Allomuricauda aequoris]